MDPVIKERAKFFEMMDKEMVSVHPVGSGFVELMRAYHYSLS